MILRRFPGAGASARRNDDSFAYFHRYNVIVHARGSDIAYAEHTAPLSIKTVLCGREVYEIAGVPRAVEAGAYLVLNEDQPYASYIEAGEEVESFCLFFRDGLAREAWAARVEPAARLLDDPQCAERQPEPFFQSLRRRDARVTWLLEGLQAEAAAGLETPLRLDERFHELLDALLDVQQQIGAEIEQLPAMRRATREELYRRLQRARDYLESCSSQPLRIADLAAVACLSPHHFLRLFKLAFGATPHQYLTELRLERARRLLAEVDRPVTDTLLAVGFENASAFARLFKRRYGVSPRQLRRAAK